MNSMGGLYVSDTLYTLYPLYIKRVPNYLIHRANEVIHGISLGDRHRTVSTVQDVIYSHTGFHVIHTNEACSGYMDYKNHCIAINEEDWDSTNLWTTALHELAHIFQYDEDLYDWSNVQTIWRSEIEADTLSVYMQLGIHEQLRQTVGEMSVPYYHPTVLDWIKKWFNL